MATAFIDDTFKEIRGRKPLSMREDFAGTAISSVDVAKLNDNQKQRIELIQEDVLDVVTDKVDILQAYNFSYWFFQERATLLHYFKQCHKGLKEDGLLFLDVFGGSECYQTQKEKRKVDGFKYIWEQAEFNAITNELKCHIHFQAIVYRQEFDEKTDEALDEYIATDEAEDYACWLGYIIAKP